MQSLASQLTIGGSEPKKVLASITTVFGGTDKKRHAKISACVLLMESSQLKTDSKINSLMKNLPEVVRNFNQLHDAVMKDGAVSEKTKELIAVGISVAIRCSPCIQRHVALAVERGNSEAEVSEAVAVGLMMAGGPAFVYSCEAMEALEKSVKRKKEK